MAAAASLGFFLMTSAAAAAGPAVGAEEDASGRSGLGARLATPAPAPTATAGPARRNASKLGAAVLVIRPSDGARWSTVSFRAALWSKSCQRQFFGPD